MAAAASYLFAASIIYAYHHDVQDFSAAHIYAAFMHEPTPPHLLNRKLSREDRKFLADYDVGDFPRSSVAVDVVLMTVVAGRMRVLLIQRGESPFSGMWSLPGGFLRTDRDTSLIGAANRVIDEKAGCGGVYLEQLATFGDEGRDPRDRVISVAYMALVDIDRYQTPATLAPSHLAADVEPPPFVGDITETAAPPPVTLHGPAGEPLELAFDHGHIIATAVHRLRGKLDWAPVGYQLLPDEFTLRELQAVHEAILGHPVNKDSFRRRMVASGDLLDLKRTKESVSHRPPALYRFKRD